jgi:hypothetical protein
MPDRHSFPPARERAGGNPAGTTERFERGEGTAGEVTLGDTDAEIITFSGKPDTIFVQARTFGAIIRMTDRLGRGSLDGHVIHAGENFETHYAAERIIARNLTAGSNALLSVFAKWAERGQ